MHADAQERAGIAPRNWIVTSVCPSLTRGIRARCFFGRFFFSIANDGSSAGRAGRRDQSKDMSSRIDLLSAARSIARSDLRSRSLVSRSSQNNYSYHKGPDFSSHRSRCLKLGRSTSQEKTKMPR
jgi:hypothetical protein